MTLDEKRMATLVLGAIGGLVIGKIAYEHVFVEGLTDAERSGMIRAGLAGATVWAVRTFVDLRPYKDYMQWIDPAGMFTASQ